MLSVQNSRLLERGLSFLCCLVITGSTAVVLILFLRLDFDWIMVAMASVGALMLDMIGQMRLWREQRPEEGGLADLLMPHSLD